MVKKERKDEGLFIRYIKTAFGWVLMVEGDWRQKNNNKKDEYCCLRIQMRCRDQMKSRSLSLSFCSPTAECVALNDLTSITAASDLMKRRLMPKEH